MSDSTPGGAAASEFVSGAAGAAVGSIPDFGATKPGTNEQRPPRASNQQSASPTDSDLFGRKIDLSVFDATGDGNSSLNLTPDPQTQLQVVFQVRKMTNQSPNLLFARIYNLSPTTRNKVIEHRRVSLSAGYQRGRYGMIFKGTVVQYRHGKENATDTYLEIIGGDGDQAYGFSTLNQEWEGGTTNQTMITDAIQKMIKDNPDISLGKVDAGEWGTQKLLRAAAANGMVHSFLRQHARAANADWFIDDGKINFVKRTGYVPGEAAVLSPATGMVGMPEVTPQGIQVQCLLNPDLRLGGLVKIDSELLSGVAHVPGSKVTSGGTDALTPDQQFAKFSELSVATWGQQTAFPAFTSPTGTYKILLMEHSGETRANPWYTTIVCVAVDGAGSFIVSPDIPFQRSIVQGTDAVGGTTSGASAAPEEAKPAETPSGSH